MCLICVEFQSNRLSLAEAKRNFGEMASGMDPEHATAVRQMLEQAEADADSEDDQA